MRAFGVRLHPEHVSASDHVQKYRRQGLVLIKSEEPQIWKRTSKKLPPLRHPPGGLARSDGLGRHRVARESSAGPPPPLRMMALEDTGSRQKVRQATPPLRMMALEDAGSRQKVRQASP